MKIRKKFNWSNLLFLLLIVLLIVPQTREPIQVALHKGAMQIFKPSVIEDSEQITLEPFSYSVLTLDTIKNEIPIGQGKVTFLSYWATWCPPCIAELPSIENLYADYGNKVNFVLISNEKPEVVDQFLKKKKLNIPAVISNMDIPNILYEKSIPTSFIIDGSGNIVLKENGARNWNANEVRDLLDKLILN